MSDIINIIFYYLFLKVTCVCGLFDSVQCPVSSAALRPDV